MKSKLIFPQGFLWGSSTSAHQVEGNNTNSDWWQWERSEQRINALRKQNKNPEEYFSGIGCDFYNRYEQDFDFAQQLNQNAFRLSIEWARIQPGAGDFSAAEIKHYRTMLASLRTRGMKTFVTLHHFTNPQWFMALGGWTKRENAKYFLDYAERVLREMGDLIDFLTPINEPNIDSYFRYGIGVWPPQLRNPQLNSLAFRTMFDGHAGVYKICKQRHTHILVGTAYNIRSTQLQGILKPFSRIAEWIEYKAFLKDIRPYCDFFGIQYYHLNRIRFSWKYPFFKYAPAEFQTDDFNWEMYPEGLYKILMELKKYRKPIYITENGVADASDRWRAGYIREHLAAVHRAITDGADVRGYLHWSLLDNFEWSEGYTKKFGLIAVDRENGLKRTIRESARVYAEICENNYMLEP